MQVLAGFLIALAIGLTGIGGGSVTTPVLVLFLGVPPAAAIGTALVFGAVVRLAAAPLYAWRGRVHFRLLGYMLAGGIPGVLAGTFVLSRIDARKLSGPVLAIVGFTIVFSAAVSLLRSWKSPDGPQRDRARLLPWIAFPIGFEVGFSSAGAGALGTIALLHLTTIAPAQVVGTDLLFGLAVSAIGGGLHMGIGGVDPAIARNLIVGGIPGVLLGAHLASRAPARKLRLGLSVWLLYLGSQMLYRGLGTMAHW
jgi:uncharacterized protein